MMRQEPFSRPYNQIAARVREARLHNAPRDEAMQKVVDALWDDLKDSGVSWVGFYLRAPDGRTLHLGPHRDKPACTPIELGGVCGRCLRERRALVIEDVRTLGEHYIACDPRDRSEVVVPVFADDGTVWAVLDLDSYDVGSFGPADVSGLWKVLAAAFGDTLVGSETEGTRRRSDGGSVY